MPQPYPKHLTPNFSIGEAARTHGNLCLMGMHVITQYSQLEVLLSGILATLLGSNPKPAVAILAVIKNSNIRSEALRAVAAETLSPDRASLFDEVLGVVETADKERNRIAHWLWATDPQISDAVVLLDPRKLASLNSDTAIVMANGSVQHAEAVALQEKMREMALVYKKADLDNAIAAVARAFFLLTTFHILLRHADGEPEAIKARNTLLNAPKVGLRQGQPNAEPAMPGSVTSSQSVTS